MSTRSRNRNLPPIILDTEESVDLDLLSDEELEEFLFEEETDKEKKGIFNLPTIAGLTLISFGILYMLQRMGMLMTLSLEGLISFLPVLGGILIILLGFGILSWRPSKKKKRVKKAIEVPSGKRKVVVEPSRRKRKKRKRLTKSTDKKMAGVCAGIAEHLNIDPTLVRIAFVIGTIATQGSFFILYLILSAILPNPEPLSIEERITIVKDR